MTSTFNEADHPRATGGTFTTKINSAPTSTLTAPTPGPSATTLVARAAQARQLARRALRIQAEANVAAASALLNDAFPGATTAIFSRDWHEDQQSLELIQILGGPEDIDATDGDISYLSEHQREAWSTAQELVSEIPVDAQDALDSGDEHMGWDEYQIDLVRKRDSDDPERLLVRSVDEFARSRMDSELSNHDGRLYSMVDTDEIVHQFEEGHLSMADPELAEKAAAAFGSTRAAAVEIGQSKAWEVFRQDVELRVRQLTPEAIENGLAEVIAAKEAHA